MVSNGAAHRHRGDLARPDHSVTVLKCTRWDEFLQVVGLTIPPLAIVNELNQSNPGLMLKFLFVAVGHLHAWAIFCSAIRAAKLDRGLAAKAR